MRIIKLSQDDEDFLNREMVTQYFEVKLPDRTPPGQFLLTKGRISADGITVGELIVFSYKGDIVYVAKAESEREDTVGPKKRQYPHYFCVDTDTIRKASGTLRQLQADINSITDQPKNIVMTRGWPRFDETDQMRQVWERYIEG